MASQKSAKPAKLSTIVVTAITVAVAIGIWFTGQNSHAAGIEVKVPELSGIAQAGQRSFAKNCAQCHGPIGNGTKTGPPLIHIIYEPGHHGDAAFYRAVATGTRQHHWKFGDMPPQPHVKRVEVQAIIKFVREVQRNNGIK